MSSFINSLLTELGTRTRLHRHTQPVDEAGPAQRRQTKPSSTSDQKHSLVHDLDQERGGLGVTGRDAGVLHDHSFFATLPKDMDRSSSEPGSTRAVSHNGPGVGQANSTDEGLPDAAHMTESALSSALTEDSRSRHIGPTGPRDSNSLESGDRSPTSNTFNLDDLGHVSLPADDGMGWLRKKIHAIRALDLTNNEKARMIHDLMTERYNSTRISSRSLSAAMSPALVPTSLEGVSGSSDGGIQQESNANHLHPTLTTSADPLENHFSLSPEDLKPTYAPRPEPESPAAEAGEEDSDTEELEASLGCQHYQRNVKLQCHTCKKWYTCRFCHDEVEDHHLIRRDTENMLCMLCGHAQPAGQDCRQCGEQTAQYYCDICKLWDNDGKKSIYHCNDCGICRIGQGLGKDFFHCKVRESARGLERSPR